MDDSRNPYHLTFHVLPLTDQDSAGPGDPAAHRTDRLPLLPSGPGGVHRVLSHRAQPLSVVLSLFYVLTCLIPTVTKSIKETRRTKTRDWRRGWDSNPRSHCWDACFPSMSIRPLSHLSTRIFERRHLNTRSDDRQGEGTAPAQESLTHVDQGQTPSYT